MRVFVLFFLLITNVCAQSNDEELLSTAQRAFDDGFHDVAIRYLEEYIPKYGGSEKINEARLLLGQCYFFKNDFDKALELFTAAKNGSSNDDVILFWIGEAYLKLSKYGEAQRSYESLLSAYPESAYIPQALYSLGWSYFDEKKYDKSQDIFSSLVRKFPKNQLSEDAFIKMAESLYNAGDYAASANQFEQYLGLFPQSSRLIQISLNLADAYYYMEDYAQALIAYEKVLKSTQDVMYMQAAYIGRIWCGIKKRMFEQAQKWIKEAMEIARTNHLSMEDLLLASGDLAYQKEDWDAALAGYTELIKAYPAGEHRLDAYLGRANAQYFLNKFDESLVDYKFVIDHRRPGEDDDLVEKAGLGLGWSYVKSGQIDAAIRSFQGVFDRADKRDVKINALIQMADAYQDLGKFNESILLYTDIIKSYGGNAYDDYVLYRQGIALLKAERFDPAISSFLRLQQLHPNSQYLEDISYYLGVAQFKKGDWNAAAGRMDGFLKALTHPSEFAPEANYILALSYLNLRESEEALKVFQKILRLYPDDPNMAKNADIGIAKCQFELGHVKEAVKRFKLIVYKYPRTDVEEESLLWLAQYAMKNSDYAGAIEFYAQIIERFPDNSQIDQIHYEMGQAYEAQGSPDQALAQYKAVSGKDTTLLSKVKLAIAGIFSKEFDPQKALVAYQNIVLNNPEYARDAYLKMAQLYRNAQDFDKEIDTYEKALKIEQGKADVENAELLFSIADAYETMNRLEEAVDNYLKVPAQYPGQTVWVVKSYLRVAKIYEDRKDWEGARVTYQKIIQLKTDESKYAQERLDWIRKK